MLGELRLVKDGDGTGFFHADWHQEEVFEETSTKLDAGIKEVVLAA